MAISQKDANLEKSCRGGCARVKFSDSLGYFMGFGGQTDDFFAKIPPNINANNIACPASRVARLSVRRTAVLRPFLNMFGKDLLNNGNRP